MPIASVDKSVASGLRITIVIPTLNRVELLQRALESALAQTLPARIVVSDNGSSDGTAAYLASIESRYPDVQLFHHVSTIPAPAHGWFLISRVETEWVVILSDDDFLEPRFVENVSSAITATSGVSFVYTGCKLHFADVVALAKVGPPVESTTDFLMGFMNGARNICMCATAFQVRDLKAIGPQPETVMIGDMFYWSRILERHPIVGCVSDPLSNYVVYRPSGDSETSRTNVSAWALESRDLADRMVRTIRMDGGTAVSPREVARARSRYLPLTISNQFVWNALRGAPRAALVAAIPALISTLLRDWIAPLRVIAAIVLPRPVLQWVILNYARLLSRGAATV